MPAIQVEILFVSSLIDGELVEIRQRSMRHAVEVEPGGEVVELGFGAVVATEVDDLSAASALSIARSVDANLNVLT